MRLKMSASRRNEPKTRLKTAKMITETVTMTARYVSQMAAQNRLNWNS